MQVAMQAIERIRLWLKAHPIFAAWIVSFCYAAYQMSWLRGTRLTDIAPDVPVVKISFTLVYVLFSFAFSIAPPVAVWAYRKLRVDWKHNQALWLIPTLWVAAEYLQSIFFSLIIAGHFGRIGSHIIIGALGYNLVRTPLVFLSRIGGIWILSGVFVFLCVAILQVIYAPKQRINILLACGILLIVAQATYLLWRQPNGASQDIAIVQIGTNKNLKEHDTAINEQIASLPQHSADIILLPEYSHYFAFTPQEDIDTASKIARTSSSILVDSYQEQSERPYINFVAYRHPNSSLVFRQHKWFLAPGGEYLPYFITGLLKASGNQKVIDTYVQERGVSSASSREQPYDTGAVKIGALACSGVVSPEVYRGMASNGATLLTNSGSLDTVGLSPLYHSQTETLGILHAVANARPFVQSARGSYSYAYDINGTLIAKDTSFSTKAMLASVQTNNTTTIYTRFGDWLALLCTFATITLLGLRFKARRN